PAAMAEDILRSRNARGQLADQAALALPEAAHGVAELVVPLAPVGREAAEAVAVGAEVPGLGDELHTRQHWVLAQHVQEAGMAVEVAGGLARERGGEIEAEAVD